MADPNPYEAPKIEQPLKPQQVVKRGIGVGLILVLTPLAVSIAFCINCSIVAVPPFQESPLVLPAITLLAMLIWLAVALLRTRP